MQPEKALRAKGLELGKSRYPPDFRFVRGLLGLASSIGRSVGQLARLLRVVPV